MTAPLGSRECPELPDELWEKVIWKIGASPPP